MRSKRNHLFFRYQRYLFNPLVMGLLLLQFTSAAFGAVSLTFVAAHPVGYNDVQWTHGFWADRLGLVKTKTIPALRAIMDGTNYSQFFRNFQIASGMTNGVYRGAPFNDGEFYKFLESEIVLYSLDKDPALKQHFEQAIAVIAKAQRPDGYIHTKTLLKALAGDTNAVPFHDPVDFETYDMGHLLTAACVHFHVTGSTNFLSIAMKCADYMVAKFGTDDPELAKFIVCPSHYMGLLDTYRATGDVRYLNLVKHLLEMRNKFIGGTDDNQDRIAFQNQTNAIGHSVRANYLYCGAADLYAETGEPVLMKTLQGIWTNLVDQKMYITGGCGALFDGASPDGGKDQKNITRVHQAYGRNYQLPNLTAHNETCANIANYMWNERMFLDTGDACYMDVAETALYNSVLSGVALDGTNFLYVNPLKHLDKMPVELRWAHKRSPFLSSFCCPPNLARTITELGASAYAVSSNGLWVNLYGANRLGTRLSNGTPIELTQETDYPWNGELRIRIEKIETLEMTIHLRIPGWCGSARVSINHQPTHSDGNLTGTPAAGGFYMNLTRAWKPGDEIEMSLDMPTKLMIPNPLVEEDINQVAIQRGPVVYCAESTDLPRGIKLSNVLLSQDELPSARFDRKLLGGVVVIDAKATARKADEWDGTRLYHELKPSASKPFTLRLIPYALWGNRGDSEMSVWLTRAN